MYCVHNLCSLSSPSYRHFEMSFVILFSYVPALILQLLGTIRPIEISKGPRSISCRGGCLYCSANKRCFRFPHLLHILIPWVVFRQSIIKTLCLISQSKTQTHGIHQMQGEPPEAKVSFKHTHHMSGTFITTDETNAPVVDKSNNVAGVNYSRQQGK